MREDHSKQNKIIIGGIIVTLIFVFIFSKFLGSSDTIKKPHIIENVVQFSSLPTTKDCALLVGFGSFKSGIDHRTHKQVVEYIRRHNSIESIQSYANGAEGAHVLCIQTKATADNKTIYKTIRKMLPAFSNKGFTSLEMDGVKKFETKWK